MYDNFIGKHNKLNKKFKPKMKNIFTISKSMHWAPITPQSMKLEYIRWF